MVKHYFDIGDDAWGLIVCYDVDVMDKDRKESIGIMDSFGLPWGRIHETIRVLEKPDTAVTITREDLRMSVMLISSCITSPSSFWNTMAHELTHVTMAIIDYYGVEYWEESTAYLQGHLFQRVVESIAVPCKN